MLEPSQNFTIWNHKSAPYMLEEMNKPIVFEHTGELMLNSVSRRLDTSEVISTLSTRILRE
ncbi:MAG TPA: hypothetical protein VLR89_09820 [Anaerolineaceae bacterium]|nr:hypothetical protein [Anaerolineaceae bacterium]